MRTATLTRHDSSDEGTFGMLATDQGLSIHTGELPWRNNEPGKSCIPPGIYTCTFRNSPKHGDCYHVENVPGRTDIEIHAANFCGDKDLGFKCELEGCIAPGNDEGELQGQRAILSSRQALADLENAFNQQPFLLTIVG